MIKNSGFLLAVLLSTVCVNAQQKLPKKDTIEAVILISDRTKLNSSPIAIKAYSVRERHNQNEKSNGDWSCWNCEDYMEHAYYLDSRKKRLSKRFIVWDGLNADYVE